MRVTSMAGVVAVQFALISCSGGGAQSAGSGTPPPVASNTLITNLVASQSFTNDATTTTATFDTSAGTTTSATAAKSTLTVRYDAAAKSYTVSETGRSQTFTPSDATTSPGPGIATYKKATDGSSDYLTLVTTPFDTSTSNRYVGLGFWQRNQNSGTRQDTTFDLFTYGLDTPAAAVPRVGTANYAMDAFAFLNIPGQAPESLQGTGTFDVDFKSGVFSQTASMSTYDVVNDRPLSTGYLPLETSGHLASADGTFTGAMSFSGETGLDNQPVNGTVAGRFYGPNGEELGATFAGNNAAGDTINGGYTGQRAGGETQNLALTNVTVAQTFFNDNAALYVNGLTGGGSAIGVRSSIALDGVGGFTYDPDNSGLNAASFGSSTTVSGPANFTSYATTVNGHPITAELYNPGPGNSELALTYASFGQWEEDGAPYSASDVSLNFFTYGIKTMPSALALRTGSAQYTGIAHGVAVDAGNLTRYALSGSSQFDVDFSAQRYSGSFSLQGPPSGGGSARDFGAFAFGGAVGNGALNSPLAQNGSSVGQLTAQFYGPDAQEIAGTFTANSGGTSIAGAVAAKQH